MNPQLKSHIDLLLEGTAEQSELAREKLGLHAPDTSTNLSNFENRIWNEYKRRAEVETASSPWKIFFTRRALMPSLAFASVLTAVGLFFFHRATPTNVEIARFDYAQSSVGSFTFGNKVKLTLRQATGLVVKNQDNHFEIKTEKIWGHFDFEKKPGNSLTIRTPHSTFSVTGTRFLLRADEKDSLLQVEEGVVEVERNGKKILVRAKEEYSSRSGEFKSAPLRETELKVFDAFKDISLKNSELSAPAAERPPGKIARPLQITVTLFDGNSITGELIQESAEALVVQPRNFKAITIKKAEIKDSRQN